MLVLPTIEIGKPDVTKSWVTYFAMTVKKYYEQFARAFNAEQLSYQFQTLDDAPTVTWDFEGFLNRSGNLLIGGNRTLTILNCPDGAIGLLKIKQDPTGGWGITLPGVSRVGNGGSGVIPLTAAPGSEDILSFVKIDSVFYWNYVPNYT